MKYSAIHKQLIIEQKDLERFVLGIKYAMTSIRNELNVPLCRRKEKVGLQPIDHIERGILDSCKSLGIDFGVEWGSQLDLTDYNT